MKTKYFSEETGKYYDSEKECLEAEKNQKNLIEKKNKDLSLQKRDLAKKIEEADNKVSQANSEYRVKKDEASKILDEAREKAQKILTEASDKIKIAEQEKINAIKEFNDKFGAYSVTYTGKKASEEIERMTDRFDRLFRNLFWF